MAICPNPPYWANGTWCGWLSQLNNISSSSDPVSSTFGVAFHAVPMIATVFLGALYVFLWVKFGQSPTKFKFIGITALVFVISVVMTLGGFIGSSLLNFCVFVLAYFLSFLFDRR